ncbi:MAG: bifunctional folylpolyglutamate synthase/dihydrofolate synthase [Bacteroidales bacterium]|nr:bifunctional folylpolyglutamate synthase/dihydrofolate synthase [Bacteroidales bacterium]
MTYQEAIEFLFTSLPMYQRLGKAAYKDNLDNTHKLDQALGHPHLSYPTIHVAGTNGKGSVSHMIASVLQASGLKTGLYTSPHLLDFRERIRINGRCIPENEVTGFVSVNQETIRKIEPSFFEMTVAMAFDYFAREQVDVAVIETGLGGRLDSTNIITPVLSVITNISMDHTEFLGTHPTSIAREKGGIIKEKVPLIIGRAESPTEEVLLSMARERKAEVTCANRIYEPRFRTLNKDGSMQLRIGKPINASLRTISCDLTGEYQQENIITALTALERLQKLDWKISEAHYREGFASVTSSTGIKGRWQTIGYNPRTICDTAHNVDGIATVIRQIKELPWLRLHMVWGMVSGKDLDMILPLLPEEATYYFTPSSVPRSMDALELSRRAREFGLKGNHYSKVTEAFGAAKTAAGVNDLIFIGGSTFVVADLLLMKI